MYSSYTKFIYFFILSIATSIVPVFSKATLLNDVHINFFKTYDAVIYGKITKLKIKKINNFYITEYNLKAKKWFYKANEIKEVKNVTIKVLGADLKDKGIIIKASTSPNYIPVDKYAVFLLRQNRLKQKNVFTLQKDGIIYKKNELLKMYGGKWDLSINTEEI